MTMCNSEKGSAGVFCFTQKFMDGNMRTLRELTPEMLVMRNKVSRDNVDVEDIPMDFETCLNEILHPELPEWNFCEPLPFAKVHMGNIAERKEGKRKSKRKHAGSDN